MLQDAGCGGSGVLPYSFCAFLYLFMGGWKRTVTDAQLMHDKGRALQAFKRRLWLHELLQQVHTAVLQDSVRTALIVNPTASRMGPCLKPARVSKQTQPLGFALEVSGTHMSSAQETEKASGFRGQSVKVPGQRKKATWYRKCSQKEKRRRHSPSVQMQERQ
ncbi:hypothetical protein ACEWY4_011378 [Coilia grayii]|uniref:Parathyroid hormone-related protein n=1 Tax=Coilia grayii TaxID=363190 RepID=A0ABD1K4W1_9TELE